MSLFKKIQDTLRESVWEQEPALQLRQKFAELDAKTQGIVQLSAVGVAGLILFTALGLLISGTLDRKNKISEIKSQIQYVKDAATKIEASRRSGSTSMQGLAGLNTNAPLPELVEQIALRASIGRGSIEIGEGDPTLLRLSRVSIRQLVRVFYILENQIPGIEWKKLSLDSRNDKSGYLWADIELRRNGEK